MTKVAILIGAVLLFAGVAAAGSLSSGGGPSSPTLETPMVWTPTAKVAPQADPQNEGLEGEASGQDEEHGNSGPSATDDNSGEQGGNSGPGGGGDDD